MDSEFHRRFYAVIRFLIGRTVLEKNAHKPENYFLHPRRA